MAHILRLGPQGRLVIPASARREAGLAPGDAVVVRASDGQIIIESPERADRRARARFVRVPRDVDLADELIADRRVEARRESSTG